MGMNFAFSWEIPFMESLQTLASDAVIKLCGLLSMFGESYLMIAAVGLFYWGINKEIGKYIAANFAAADLLAPFAKNLISRRRPYMDHPSVQCLRQAYPGDIYDLNVQGYSCPSLHASNTGAVFGSISLFARTAWGKILLNVLVLLIGASRVILGVHYPTDILLGWLIAWISMQLMPRISVMADGSYLRLALIFAVIGLPGWFLCSSEDFFVGYGAIIGIFLGFHFEERHVAFENTANKLRLVIRTLGGIVFTLGVLEGLKLFFPAALMDTPGTAAYAIRAFRYAAGTFAGMGIYPMLFIHTDRFIYKHNIKCLKE